MLGKTFLGISQPTAGAVRLQGARPHGLSKAVVRQICCTPQ
jgi:hypothetical protein